MGAMLPYAISCIILKATHKVGPVICHDVLTQME